MSPTVNLQEIEPTIWQITMEDREHKNTFSNSLVDGLIIAFEKIKQNDTCKAVILTGYDSYFASGGTKEGLLKLQKGEGKFTDLDIYSLALKSPVPVISAMQGHGIGGGFVLGLFSDFVVLSKESIYTTNFMKYGFTPGMGATYIVPKKLGLALGHEMLLNAQAYRGQDLQDRGVGFPVYPRSQVMEQSIKIARQLAQKPRIALTNLKKHLVSPLLLELPTIIEEELLMHQETFHHDEVRKKIEELF
jgi:polyketide biosynthesis enoyl-CoA hydratase PksI